MESSNPINKPSQYSAKSLNNAAKVINMLIDFLNSYVNKHGKMDVLEKANFVSISSEIYEIFKFKVERTTLDSIVSNKNLSSKTPLLLRRFDAQDLAGVGNLSDKIEKISKSIYALKDEIEIKRGTSLKDQLKSLFESDYTETILSQLRLEEEVKKVVKEADDNDSSLLPQNTWEELPVEIIERIFSYLPDKDLGQTLMTAKFFNVSDDFWKDRIIQNLNISKEELAKIKATKNDVKYKDLYVQLSDQLRTVKSYAYIGSVGTKEYNPWDALEKLIDRFPDGVSSGDHSVSVFDSKEILINKTRFKRGYNNRYIVGLNIPVDEAESLITTIYSKNIDERKKHVADNKKKFLSHLITIEPHPLFNPTSIKPTFVKYKLESEKFIRDNYKPKDALKASKEEAKNLQSKITYKK